MTSEEEVVKPEDFLIELVCNARWIADYCCNELNPETKAAYEKDVVVCEEMLNSLRKPLGHIEVVSELPRQCVQCLCRGVAYLLCAEGMLTNQVPPTMHHYLRQSQDRRADKAYETQFLVVRWFLSIELISRDELLRVLHGEMDGLGGDNSMCQEELTTEALSSMMAKALADPDPFYIGAHVVLTRALMLRHCSSIVSIDDILGHAALLAPPDVSMETEPHTLEDALLFWLRTAIALVDPTPPADASETGGGSEGGGRRQHFQELAHVDDLYLHTNDGRVLSLVMQQYRPDLLDSTKIHYYNPLTVWNRQENWVNIIGACEALFLFVGVYPDEVVAHGFTKLQYHVIRIILEVFAVMAMDSEKTFESMCEALDTDTTFVQIRQSLGGYVSLQAPPVTEALVDTLNEPPMSAREQQEKSREVEHHSQYNTPAEGNTPGDTKANNSAQQRRSSGGAEQQYELKQPPALEDSQEYNVILTGMFLQGVSMPVGPAAASNREQHTQQQPEVSESPEAKAAQDTTTRNESAISASANDTTTGFEIHDANQFRQSGMTNHTEDDDDAVNIESPQRSTAKPDRGQEHGGRTNATDTSSASYTVGGRTDEPSGMVMSGETSDMEADTTMLTNTDVQGSVDLSYSLDPAVRLFESQITEGTPASSVGGNSPAMAVGDAGPQQRVGRNLKVASDPTRSVSPNVTVSRDRRLKQLASGRAEPTNPLLASMAHFKSQKNAKTQSRKGGAGGLTSSVNVLQGSMDAQGIEELFAELAALADASSAAAAAGPTTTGGSPRENAQQENAHLKAMLHRQQQQIGLLVDRMKKQVKQQELSAIMGYMRTQNKKKVQPTATGVSTATSTRGSFAARQLTQLSPNQVREKGPPHAAKKTVETKQSAPQQPSRPPGQAQQERNEDVSPTLTEATQVAPSTTAQTTGKPQTAAAPLRRAEEVKQRGREEEDVSKEGSNTFDISIGGLGKGKKSDGLSVPQLQKLKERHEERRNQQKQKVAGAGAVLPSLGKRNNKSSINNALRYACLSGPINKSALDNSLAVVEDEGSTHLIILLKDEFNHTFRGVYAERETKLTRVFGAGPLNIPIPAAPGPSGIAGVAPCRFFRYDTGPKNFSNFNGKQWDSNVDAIAYCGGKAPKSIM